MLEELRKRLAAKLQERSTVQRSFDELVETVQRDNRTDFTEDESKHFNEYRDQLNAFDVTDSKAADYANSIADYRTRITELEALATRKSNAESIAVPTPGQPPVIRVGAEARVYSPGSEHGFLKDALRARDGDWGAAQRLHRNREEMIVEYRERDAFQTRAGTTADFGTLVVPTYMTDEFAPVLRSGRPFLNAVGVSELPDEGMSIYIPLGVTGTAILNQTTENLTLTNQSYTTAGLTVPVCTYGGIQNISRQAVERGRGIDSILMNDLAFAYATQVNLDAINGPGTSNRHWGILNTTNVQTAAWIGTTGASLVASLHNALGKINGARFAGADLVVMHPRRWAWLCAQSDANGRPLVNVYSPAQGQNIVGQGSASGYGAPVGSVAGVEVVTDAGVPIVLGGSTDEDRIIVTRKSDVLFMESPGAPKELRFEEVVGDALTVRLVAYDYSAFTAGRYPVATCIIQGTGFKQILT